MKSDETSKVRTEESTKTTFVGGNAELVWEMNGLKDEMSSFKSELNDMKQSVVEVTTLLKQVVDSTGGISHLRQVVSGDVADAVVHATGMGSSAVEQEQPTTVDDQTLTVRSKLNVPTGTYSTKVGDPPAPSLGDDLDQVEVDIYRSPTKVSVKPVATAPPAPKKSQVNLSVIVYCDVIG